LDFIVSKAAAELELTAVRADRLADPGQITLQVIEHVTGARAAVADLTGRNPNVFYELAIRHTARLPVVLIAEQGEQLPFDIAQMRVIFFNHRDLRSADQCRASIVAQLRQAFEGAVDSPIAASVDLRNLQAGSAVERQVAELVETVNTMASDLSRLRLSTDLLLPEAERAAPISPISPRGLVFRMTDDSMRAFGIAKGDLLMIKPQDASDGDLVAFIMGDETTVRQLVFQDGKSKLVSGIASEEPIEFDKEQMRLIGVVQFIQRPTNTSSSRIRPGSP
jgi:hypothetical protein